MSETNFEVYQAASVPRTFLVVSTSAGLDAGPPDPRNGFGSAPALDSLADELTAAYSASDGEPVPVTLKVHGFNMRRGFFEREIIADAKAFRPGAGGATTAGPSETFRPDDRFLIGYRWPSEGMLSRESLRDTGKAVWFSPAIFGLMLLLPLHGLLVNGDLERMLGALAPILGRAVHAVAQVVLQLEAPLVAVLTEQVPWLAAMLGAALAPFSGPTGGAIWLGAGLLVLLLRLSTYSRDRYRVIHYGVPDLGEFMKELEGRLHARHVRVRLDVIGHSMGTLLLINAFRVMSDFFHGRRESAPVAEVTGLQPAPSAYNEIGRDGTFRLGSLILCAPDIPAVMATTDHNNYFQSALRRFDSIHVFSSDRDLILKWLSTIANWMSEPRHDMAGRKLGNVHLVRGKRPPIAGPDSRADWTLWPMSRPILLEHHLYTSDPVGQATPAKVHFHDCTADPSVSGSYGAMAGASVVVTGVLLLVGMGLHSAPIAWLGGVLGFFLCLGIVARPLWPRLRDHGLLGSAIAALSEPPTLMMYATYWRSWDPHGGYFRFGSRPRQRICQVLRDPDAFPPRDAQNHPIEESDGPIRYRLVQLSP